MKLYACIAILLLSVIDVFAQRSVTAKPGPFTSLQFLNGPTDTISFIVSYTNMIGKVSDSDMDTFSAISKLNGSNFKKFSYAIGFNIPGYAKSFYVPCKDNALYYMILAKKSAINRIKLNCVVYRFFFTDGIYNFFCVNKASIID
jgi:hypothetical protein